MKDHILCAIDFSDSSVNALKWAYTIAKGGSLHLGVLYSYRLLQIGELNDIVSFRRKTEEDSRKKFKELEKMVFSEEVSTSFITEIGFYSDTIESYLRKNPNTMIVLGETMAYSIYEHKGQSLIHFLKALHVPVLIVPDKKEMAGFNVEHPVTKGKIAI